MAKLNCTTEVTSTKKALLNEISVTEHFIWAVNDAN
jgi:hypothetical protein